MKQISINNLEDAYKALENYRGMCRFTYKRKTGDPFEEDRHVALDVDSVEIRFIVKGSLMQDRDKRLSGCSFPDPVKGEFDLSEFSSMEIRGEE
jgi:hypothetical protein